MWVWVRVSGAHTCSPVFKPAAFMCVCVQLALANLYNFSLIIYDEQALTIPRLQTGNPWCVGWGSAGVHT